MRRINLSLLTLLALCLLGGHPAAAQQATATFTYPVDGQQNVDTRTPVAWTSVANAQGYYLYVGTAKGLKDLVNTGWIQQTSYKAPPLPVGRTLYGRINTKTSTGQTKYQDITFTAAFAPASFTYPLDGASDVNGTKAITWTAVPGAQTYYLYVGTSQGTADVINSWETQATFYPGTSLPIGIPLWGRIWTKYNNFWHFEDIRFTVSRNAALFTYPTNGAQNVDIAQPFTWTTVQGALSYYLYVGTSPGAKDLVNTGEIRATSYTTPLLPDGQTLYARINTKGPGGWSYQDITFTAAPSPTRFTYPTNGHPNVDTSRPFQWVPIKGAQAYYLYVGTTPGAKDLVDSWELTQTSYKVPPLPVGQTIYARIWTKLSGVWKYTDISFNAALAFVYPRQGEIAADPALPVRWPAADTVNGVAPYYYFSLGTGPGKSDLLNSGPLQQTSYQVPPSALPQGRVLYARIEIRLGDKTWRRGDSAFTVAGTPVTPAQILYPLDGQTNVDVSTPFQWTATDLAQAYRLQILSGGQPVRDSGEIHVPRYFASDLPLGSYTGVLGTQIDGQWYGVSFAFAVTRTGAAVDKEVSTAQWATDFARNMGDSHNYPYTWTPLFTLVVDHKKRVNAVCTEYRDALLQILLEMNIARRLPAELQPRALTVAFNTNSYETHTLVEMYNPEQQVWMLLDPTFDMVMRRATDGLWATKEDVQAATLARNWTAITYIFLGSYGDSIARGYYLDYPLLYLNLPPLVRGVGVNPMPYMEEASSIPTNRYGLYVVSSNQTPLTAVVDGQPKTLDCTGINGLSQAFFATTVGLPSGSTAQVRVFRVPRYMF